MWKKLILSIIFITFITIIIVISSPVVRADTEQDLQNQINDLQNKITSAQNQEKTLSSQITLINNEISLTKLKITQTGDKLGRLTTDIDSVSGKISQLEKTLYQVSLVLTNRISKTYITGRQDPMLYLLSSVDVNDFLQKFEYLRIVQKHDKTLLTQMSATRKNYYDQKDLLVNKKTEVQKLSDELKSYQSQLAQQNREKQILLESTQNDEKRYQSLLARAQAQLAAFSGFVNSQGGASPLSNQTSCNDWGCYYNQRDSQWGLMRIGFSSESLSISGCLVTSSAMILSHYGHKVTPAQVAQTYNAFDGLTAMMRLAPWSIDGATFTRTSYCRDFGTIDSELSSGKPIIVGVGGTCQFPNHFVVLKSKDGNGYTMNDPYVENGHDIPFTSHYSLGSITAVNTVRVN